MPTIFPWPALYLWRKIRSLKEDFPIIVDFLFKKTKTSTSFLKRLLLILQFYKISYLVDCPHMENEMIRVAQAILNLDPKIPGVILEAGSYKGGSGAKISQATAIIGRKLYLFDSFEGLPEHKEIHSKNIYGGDAYFPAGSYKGTIEEVKSVIRKYGRIENCEFIKGWFNDTMPNFKEPIAVAYIDVDLKSSTETCLKYLYPLLADKGILFSQDGHLPWIIELLKDNSFWEKIVKIKKPEIKGLGIKKLIEIIKP